jgi:hypothetical protein
VLLQNLNFLHMVSLENSLLGFFHEPVFPSPEYKKNLSAALGPLFQKFAETFAAQGAQHGWQMEKIFNQKSFN